MEAFRPYFVFGFSLYGVSRSEFAYKGFVPEPLLFIFLVFVRPSILQELTFFNFYSRLLREGCKGLFLLYPHLVFYTTWYFVMQELSALPLLEARIPFEDVHAFLSIVIPGMDYLLYLITLPFLLLFYRSKIS